MSRIFNKSVTVNTLENFCSAYLPFTADPDLKLVTNADSSSKVYFSQVRSLNKSHDDLLAVIEAEGKLQKLGYVDYLENLSKEDQGLILDKPVMYYIPWRVAWSKSVTTPARPVFDGSMRPPKGCSINEILPVGTNNMNNLIQILVRWQIKPWGYHTDISKHYNSVAMEKRHWRYQLYWWDENLDPTKAPRTKVIKTCIYGLKPSGNQAERALRLTAEKCKDQYPKAYEVIHKDFYVDDGISGEDTEDGRDVAVAQLNLCTATGGFSLKGFTFSGQDPDKKLSVDGKSITVGGMKWFPKDDYVTLNIGELNFCKKLRGRKVSNNNEIPDELTVRDCASKVGEVFDPLGRVTPITAGLKLDTSFLHRSGLSWNDPIPENLRSVWTSNFEMIQELKHLKYKRAIVPHDAKNLDIVTIDTGDASDDLICAAIYARFEKKDGSYSCQLVFSRSKVLPEGTTTPRGELMAAVMNAATGYTVMKAFGNYHKKAFKLTDSTVTLHWLSSEHTAQKTWVRTRSIEANRLSKGFVWYQVDGDKMVADLGTRKGLKPPDVGPDTLWFNNFPWASGPESEFPIRTVEDIKLNQQEMAEVMKETLVLKTFHSQKKIEVDAVSDEEIKTRYEFSDYLIDPNRFRFRKVSRVFSIVLDFIYKISKNVPKVRENKVFHPTFPFELPDILTCSNDKYLLITGTTKDLGPIPSVKGRVIVVSERMLKSAFYYFALKASEEVKHFVDKYKYVNITKEIGGVLYYSGRILTDYQFGGYPELCEAAIDLCRTTFCVPVMDQFSPVAISIALEIHWHHPDVMHRGIESILRQMERVTHIVGGRKLAISTKEGCKKCRILNSESVEMAMGPIQDVNLCIAPPFFATQIDIFGPFKAYSIVNKRATIKVWFLIFCCCTTGATDIRVMEDYSSESVVLAFIRFSCTFGYPRYALPDAGSQLVKSCADMKYSYTDVKQTLSTEYGIEYAACPVGAHYVHGKVERKIQEVKKSVNIHVQNERLSVIQWETLMLQISNSINNLPIGLKNKTSNLENLDLITPNRLILGRNNNRCPNAPLLLCSNHKKMIDQNSDIFKAWFKAWIISYVPQLIERPKWHTSDREMNVGDVVLFLKSEREFDEQYQYGIVCAVHEGKDGHIRRVDVEYRNANENTKRITQRGVRDLVIVFPVDELDIYERLNNLI